MTDSASIAFVFPGVAVPLCGREFELWDRYPGVFAPLVGRAAQRVGLELEGALRRGALFELSTVGQQALGYAFSVGSARVFEEVVGTPVATAGYSFGIYAAVTAAGAWRFEEGLEALLEAERIMTSLLPEEPCGLGVVLGLDAASVSTCLLAEPAVAVVNRNTEQCFVLAGPRADLARACAEAERLGAMSGKLLPVAVPYHHPGILSDARGLFARWLTALPLQAPTIPVISSLDGECLLTAQGIARYAADNLSSPLDWLSALKTIDSLNIDLVLECGLGLSLSQNARFAPLRAEHGNCRNYARFARS
ncbi:MAG: hypothetical protein MUC50_15555 [Myxococcota bacterium]|jgi:malonyl CoA-acyl carrier protein transacylase|nr:hypothetical protein [Myxococcota bacterium]